MVPLNPVKCPTVL